MKSTVSLPNFTFRRIRSAQKKLNTQNLTLSSDQIILKCLEKLIRHFPQNVLKRTRLKQYNHRTAHYEIHSVRWSVDFYNTLHFHAHKTRVSVSLMADVAISLYLADVLEILLSGEENYPSTENNYVAKHGMKNKNTWILQEIFTIPEWCEIYFHPEISFLLRLSDFPHFR